MGRLPDDTVARQESLERWAVQQRGAEAGPAPRPSRMREKLIALRNRLAARSQRWADWVFDRRMETGGIITEPEHKHPDRNLYVPSAWHVLPRALRYVGVSDRDTFADFGCGKGRIVQQAAKRPFRRVIGVEISPALVEVARSNLA